MLHALSAVTLGSTYRDLFPIETVSFAEYLQASILIMQSVCNEIQVENKNADWYCVTPHEFVLGIVFKRFG